MQPGDVDPAELERRRPVAIQIARAFIRRIPPSVSGDDVEQAALIGLWDGLRRSPGQTGEAFEWFLRRRIRGAIIDELRKQDWLPRRIRAGEAASLGAHVSVVHLEDDRDQLHWAERLSVFGASVEDILLVRSQAEAALRAPMQPKDRRTVELLIFRGFKMRDVARELGCSEPRVSQRFSRAIDTMRLFLTGNADLPNHKPSTLSVRDRNRIVLAKEGKI